MATSNARASFSLFSKKELASKFVYSWLNHELEVSNPLNIQTECSVLTVNSDAFFKEQQQQQRQKVKNILIF